MEKFLYSSEPRSRGCSHPSSMIVEDGKDSTSICCDKNTTLKDNSENLQKEKNKCTLNRTVIERNKLNMLDIPETTGTFSMHKNARNTLQDKEQKSVAFKIKLQIIVNRNLKISLMKIFLLPMFRVMSNVLKFLHKHFNSSWKSIANISSAFMGELAASVQAAENEENDKNKVEKRKEKKKRRKEKKKLEKLTQNKATEKQESKETSSSTSCKKNEEATAALSDSSDEDKDFDTNSAFVSVIAKKHKIHNDLEIKEAPHNKFSKFPKEDPSSIVFRSRQIALRGNTMASTGHYSQAAELFSESIKMDPSDHRFYGNRSYCHDRLGQFERALKDAEKSIALCPVWPKGYFRKGRALLGLKKYAEAEECFVEVLRLDEECEDAVCELRNVKILQIMEKGYSKELAEYAISQYSTVSEALTSLVANKVSQLQVEDDIFISDDENEMWNSISKPKIPEHLYDIKRDPNNPEGHNSIWIGNLRPEITENKLLSMFSKFGEIISVKVMPEKFCAFVNYKSKTSPGKAMQTYQGYELNGTKLVIRFPNLPGEAVPMKKKASSVDGSRPKGAVNGDECYYWRTTGCIYAERCRFKHKKENKGIDKQIWMG